MLQLVIPQSKHFIHKIQLLGSFTISAHFKVKEVFSSK
jgi:hypothetical protein